MPDHRPPWTRDECQAAVLDWLAEAYGMDPNEIEVDICADGEGEWSGGNPEAGRWSGHWVCEVWEGDANECRARGEEPATLYVHEDGGMEGLYG